MRRGRGRRTPFPGGASGGRYASAAVGPARAVAGVIVTHAAHRRPTGSRRLDGGRGRERVPGQIGGAAPAAVSACRSRAPAVAACPGEGWPEFRELWYRRPAWIIVA